MPENEVVEGLGQTAQLLASLDVIRKAGAERNDEGLGLRTLELLDAGYSLRPSATPSHEGLALLQELATRVANGHQFNPIVKLNPWHVVVVTDRAGTQDGNTNRISTIVTS